MTIALKRGPIEPIDINAVMGDAPAWDLESVVAGHLDDLGGVDDRIRGNLSTMASDLDGLGEFDPGGDLDEASGAHDVNADGPDPDFSGEADAAAAGSAQLARLAGELPADPDQDVPLTIDDFGDGFNGVEINYDDAAPRFDRLDSHLDRIEAAIGAIPGGGGGGGGGGDGRTPERQKCYDEALAAGIPQAELDAFLEGNPGDECRAIHALRG